MIDAMFHSPLEIAGVFWVARILGGVDGGDSEKRRALLLSLLLATQIPRHQTENVKAIWRTLVTPDTKTRFAVTIDAVLFHISKVNRQRGSSEIQSPCCRWTCQHNERTHYEASALSALSRRLNWSSSLFLLDFGP